VQQEEVKTSRYFEIPTFTYVIGRCYLKKFPDPTLAKAFCRERVPCPSCLPILSLILYFLLHINNNVQVVCIQEVTYFHTQACGPVDDPYGLQVLFLVLRMLDVEVEVRYLTFDQVACVDR